MSSSMLVHCGILVYCVGVATCPGLWLIAKETAEAAPTLCRVWSQSPPPSTRQQKVKILKRVYTFYRHCTLLCICVYSCSDMSFLLPDRRWHVLSLLPCKISTCPIDFVPPLSYSHSCSVHRLGNILWFVLNPNWADLILAIPVYLCSLSVELFFNISLLFCLSPSVVTIYLSIFRLVFLCFCWRSRWRHYFRIVRSSGCPSMHPW